MASQKKKTDWGWPLIIVLFVIGAWPIALVLLLIKLFKKDGQKQRVQAPPLSGSIPEKKETAPKARKGAGVTRSPAEKRSTARMLRIIGAIVAAVGLVACWEPIQMMIFMGGVDLWYVEDLLAALALTVGGAAMLCSGTVMDRRLKRYAKYLAVLGDYEAMSLEQLSRTLGFSRGQVERDLEKMLDQGYFGPTAYLNMELGYLFRSGKAMEELRAKQAAQAAQAAQTPKEAEEGYSGILRSIRRANDAIADPVLSAKIDRLEEITARIFRAVEEDPRKAGRIDTFLNYYLPTTQKLLDSYAEFEAAGVEGENLRQAKGRIESTMDAIIRGFEHQLDELYKADAMDVDSDIRVMETMLRRDTATVEEDFGLGAAAERKEKT